MQAIADTHKIFIVEDSPSVRRRLIELLGEIENVCIAGEAESPQEAVAGICRTLPHCVLLDFRLAGGTAVDVLRAVHPVLPDIGFIVLTNHPNEQYRRASMQAGAVAFLDKSSDPGGLKERIAEYLFNRESVAKHDG
jgi:two-component system, NarL family, response regulator DevR